MLDISAASQTIIVGGSTLITGTIRNTGPDGGDGIGYTGFSGTSTAGSLGLAPQAGSVATKTSTTGTGSFTSNTPGLYTIQPTVTTATNSTLGTNANLTSTGSVTVNVLAHSAPVLTMGSGGGQTIITGGSFAPISYTLSNPGSDVSALQVGSLSNLAGATGTGVVAAASTGTYTATAPSNTTVATGNQVVSLQAGDDQSLSGADPLQSLSGTFSYTVLDHSTASLSGTGTMLTGTISLGIWDWEQSAWVSGSGSNSYALYNLSTTSPELTAGLDVSGTSIGGDPGFSTNFDLSSYSLISGGSSSSFMAMYTPSGTVSGTYTATFTFQTKDQNLPGGTPGNTLILTAQVVVVPEPAAIALAGLGAGLAGLLAWRSRKRRAA
jgi:hypothetical protein